MRYFLELCLKSVQAAIAELDAEIIVVDNHSQDGSCMMVKRQFPQVVLVENKENLGFSKGNNIGAQRAKGTYLCFLNPDTVVAEDTFVKALAYAESNDQMGLLGCQLIDGSGKFLPESKRHVPTPMVALKKMLGYSTSYYVNTLSPEAVGEVEVLVGAFMLIKNKVFQQVNGFDEDYFMYGEDIDLSYKVLKAGYKNMYHGQTAVIHYKGESTIKDKAYTNHFYGAMHIFYRKHFKSHFLFDLLVALSVRFWHWFTKEPRQGHSEVSGHALVTNNPDFDARLPFHVNLCSNYEDIPPHTQVVFDGNTVDYSTIIEKMTVWGRNKNLTFRILPKNASFIIGSDSVHYQGEVVLF